MSLPFYYISCTGCDYSGRYSYSIRYIYEHGVNASPQPLLQQGWCKFCQNVVTIAVPLQEHHIAREKEAYEELITPRRRFIIFRKQPDPSVLENQKQRLDKLKKSVEYYQKNPCAKRCLTCQSTEVKAVALPSTLESPTPIGAQHECGGELIANAAGRFSFAYRKTVTYDSEGCILTDEREEGTPRNVSHLQREKLESALERNLWYFHRKIYQFFTGNLYLPENDVTRKEITYFCLSIFSIIYLRFGADKNKTEILDNVTQAVLTQDVEISGLTSSYGKAVSEHQTRYKEYGPLFFALFKDEAKRPHVTLLLYLYSKVTGRTGMDNMLRISGASDLFMRYLIDQIEFVKQVAANEA